MFPSQLFVATFPFSFNTSPHPSTCCGYRGKASKYFHCGHFYSNTPVLLLSGFTCCKTLRCSTWMISRDLSAFSWRRKHFLCSSSTLISNCELTSCLQEEKMLETVFFSPFLFKQKPTLLTREHKMVKMMSFPCQASSCRGFRPVTEVYCVPLKTCKQVLNREGVFLLLFFL